MTETSGALPALSKPSIEALKSDDELVSFRLREWRKYDAVRWQNLVSSAHFLEVIIDSVPEQIRKEAFDRGSSDEVYERLETLPPSVRHLAILTDASLRNIQGYLS